MSLVDRFVVGVDVQRYSARVTRQQQLLRRELDRMLDEAAEAAGASRAQWYRVDGGDGEIAVLPADVNLLAVVRGFVSELDLRLADHNEDHAPETEVRLRVAMHSGSLTPLEGGGYTGPAFTVLRRLLDSEPVRAALKEVPEAHLAQIISGSVYERAVVPELGGLRPRQFREVKVDLPAKEFHETAYVHVPGGWPEPKRPDFKPSRPPFPVITGQPAPSPETTTRTTDPDGLVYGIQKSLARHDIEQADKLTTRAILVSVGQASKGWLRESHGHEIPDELLTELDMLWAVVSAGAWGFRAQRQCVREYSRPGRHTVTEPRFHALSRLFGWRGEQETATSYSEFVQRASHEVPFYPTLRDSRREDHPTWYDEWRTTVLSVHGRLRSWER
jgi:hypothetical protein